MTLKMSCILDVLPYLAKDICNNYIEYSELVKYILICKCFKDVFSFSCAKLKLYDINDEILKKFVNVLYEKYCVNMKYIEISSNNVTHNEIFNMVNKIKNLIEVSLIGLCATKRESINIILISCSMLETIKFVGDAYIYFTTDEKKYDEYVEDALFKFETISSKKISMINLSNQYKLKDIKILANKCSETLRELNLSFCKNLSIDTEFKKFKNLEILDLNGCNISDDIVRHICLKSLRHLILANTGITNNGLKHIQYGCEKLIYLDLSGCYRLSNEGFMELAMADFSSNLITLK